MQTKTYNFNHGVRKKDGGRTVRLLPAYFWLGRIVFARRHWRRMRGVWCIASSGWHWLCAASFSSDVETYHFCICTRLHFMKKSVNRDRASRKTKHKLSKMSNWRCWLACITWNLETYCLESVTLFTWLSLNMFPNST